jgi:general secretion pathway protein B
MSYILDALKKSEQERGNGNIPSVQTIHSSSLNYADKRAIWPYFLVAALLLNLIAILYFVFDQEEVTEDVITTTDKPHKENSGAAAITESSQDDIQQIPAIDASNHSDIEEIIYDRPVKTTTTMQAQEVTSSSNDLAPRQSTAPATKTANTYNKTVIEFHELPESIKQQLPAIIISAHVYSSNPLQRSIVINNNFLEEGEYVLDDLVLHEITSDGAIFSYHDTFFHHGVVNSWQ